MFSGKICTFLFAETSKNNIKIVQPKKISKSKYLFLRKKILRVNKTE